MAKPSILIVSGNIFRNVAGDSIFSSGVIYRLSKHFDITLFTFYEREKKIQHKEVCGYVKQLYLQERSFSIRDRIIQLFKYGSAGQTYSKKAYQTLKKILTQNEYNYILIDHLRVYSLYSANEKIIKKHNIKTIFLNHNIEHINREESLCRKRGISRVWAQFLTRWVKKLETDAITRSSRLWCLTNSDLEYLLALIKKTKLKALVIPPYYPYKRVKEANSLRRKTFNLLILGSMGWYPNIEGALHFLREIFPNILKENNSYKLFIVGGNPPVEIVSQSSANVIVTGRVESVDSYIENADLMVLPNKLGTGIKIKVMEATMKGLPVIMYSESSVGYPKNIFRPPFVADTPEDFANNVTMVNNNAELKEEFITKCQEYFNKYCKEFDFELYS